MAQTGLNRDGRPGPLSVGRYRALQRVSRGGRFAILAIDHQDSLKRALRPDDPAAVTAEALMRFKLAAVQALAPAVDGVLLDPVYGAPQAVVAGVLDQTGLLVELEKADYQMQPLPLDVEIDPEWSVGKIKRMGADGVKLFFYYNPQDAGHSRRQDAVVRQVAADCARHDIPLYAEPILYGLDGAPVRRDQVVEAARRVADLGADVLKLEFPAEPQPTDGWLDACRAVTEAAGVPWVLLSAGVTFDQFARQLEAACRAGASGFIVGRAVWGDAARILADDQRREWLHTEGRRRLALLRAIADLHAAPWQTYTAPPAVDTDWFRGYAPPPGEAG